MMNIRIYHHVYLTVEGIIIEVEQEQLLASVGLTYYPITKGYENTSNISPNYEGRTLQYLWEDARKLPPFFALYIHTKGASHPESHRESMKAFRDAIGSVVINEWQSCIALLSERTEEFPNGKIDCYGSFFPTDNRFFFPGNFWWANSNHIKSLPCPIVYAKASGRKGENIRYAYEDWITMSHPDIRAAAKYKWQPDNPEGKPAEEWSSNCYHTFEKGNHVITHSP